VNSSVARALITGILCGLVGLGTGCATGRIDWAGRVGTYTFDQAVQDLGPPDKQAKRADGTVVAEWITRRGYRQAYAPLGYSCYPYYYGPLFPTYIETYSPDYFLRLTFDPRGVLKGWKKFSR